MRAAAVAVDPCDRDCPWEPRAIYFGRGDCDSLPRSRTRVRTVAGKIFINYRRGDDAGFAQALFAHLMQVFSPDQLFMDVDNIEPGLDFVRVLDEQVAKSDVLITVIGKGWIDARDEAGSRRLDNPNDFVRIEIESALNQDKRVIPVLVGQAQMPRPEQLPETMKSLARRNAVRLTHERFRSDTQALIAALQRALKNAEEARKADADVAQLEAETKKRRDEEARPGSDVVASAPASVISGRTLDELLGDAQ